MTFTNRTKSARSNAALVLTTTTVALSAAASAMIPADQDPPRLDEAIQLEDAESMPWMPNTTDRRSGGPRTVIEYGDYIHRQVNVSFLGNIQGDAANEPSIAIDPTAPNRMAAGWRQFDTINSNFRQAGYSSSNDGGRTWRPLRYIEGGIFRSDPVLTAADDGTFYYLSLSTPGGNFTCDLFISEDGGNNWPIKTFAYGGDKSWLAIDPGKGLGSGNLYQPWNVAGNLYFPAQFNRSVDPESSFEEPVEFDPNSGNPARPVFGQVAVGPDGEVYVAGSRNSFNTPDYWVVRSTNASDPQQTPVFDQITPIDVGGTLPFAEGPNPAGLLGQVEIDVDRSEGPRRGHVYVVASINPPGNDPLDIHFMKSTDGGATFSAPQRLNGDLGDNYNWFGTMSVAPNGRIDVVWLDTRTSGQANVSALFYSSSSDGGDTWTVDEQISPEFDTWIGWPQQNKIGDYFELESDLLGANLIWAATFNGEQDVYFTRIGPYDCNMNGLDDDAEIADGSAGDCNTNNIPDSCDIAAGILVDTDGDGIPDICDVDCPEDLDGSGNVGVDDLLQLLGVWGPCDDCPEDFDASGAVDVNDLLQLIAAWGPCR